MGYRYWSVQAGKLVAPFAGEVLPDDGVAIATCDVHPNPPGPRCCGIGYYSTRTALPFNLLDPHEHAITAGEVTGPTMPDTRAQLYQDGLQWVSLRPGRRCARYAVQKIYTDAMVDYPELTVCSWPS